MCVAGCHREGPAGAGLPALHGRHRFVGTRPRGLPAGCCVALHSGWGELAISDPARFIGRDIAGDMHFPGFSPDAAAWLLKERDVAGIAVDTLSLDNGPSQDFLTHRLWLPSGRWGLENVANLDQVPASGRHPCRRRPEGEGCDRRARPAYRAGVVGWAKAAET
jgi:kynurenine formamidase